MRSDVCVGGKQALAVVLSDVAHLSYPITVIRKAINAGKYGQTVISKDFLQPGEDSTIVKRGTKSKRRRCDAIYMEAIDQDTCDQLQKREHYIFEN